MEEPDRDKRNSLSGPFASYRYFLVKTTPDLFFLKEAKFLWRQNDRMLRSFTGIKKKNIFRNP
jgi:hypothetical protein